MPHFLVSNSHSSQKILASLKCMKFLQPNLLAIAWMFTSPFLFHLPTTKNFIKNTLAKSVAASSTLIIKCRLESIFLYLTALNEMELCHSTTSGSWEGSWEDSAALRASLVQQSGYTTKTCTGSSSSTHKLPFTAAGLNPSPIIALYAFWLIDK